MSTSPTSSTRPSIARGLEILTRKPLTPQFDVKKFKKRVLGNRTQGQVLRDIVALRLFEAGYAGGTYNSQTIPKAHEHLHALEGQPLPYKDFLGRPYTLTLTAIGPHHDSYTITVGRPKKK